MTVSETETLRKSPQSTREAFWAGVRRTFPLIVGTTPFGIIFGALAVANGLSANATYAMSAFVFAGSAQFIAIGLIGAGVNIPLIIGTTFVVNLRHMLYSATLGPHFKGLKQRWMLPLSFWLTDEAFAASSSYFRSDANQDLKKYFLLGSELFMYLNWQWVTWLGVRMGQAIPDPAKWGLDFAMVVTFIGMLIPEIKDRPSLGAAVVAGGAALLANNLPNQFGLLLAALLGISAALLIENNQNKKEMQ